MGFVEERTRRARSETSEKSKNSRNQNVPGTHHNRDWNPVHTGSRRDSLDCAVRDQSDTFLVLKVNNHDPADVFDRVSLGMIMTKGTFFSRVHKQCMTPSRFLMVSS